MRGNVIESLNYLVDLPQAYVNKSLTTDHWLHGRFIKWLLTNGKEQVVNDYAMKINYRGDLVNVKRILNDLPTM